MNKKIWTAIGASALLAASVLPAIAATSSAVTATVTPGIISVVVSPSGVDYGTVEVPSPDNVPTGDTIIGATNNGGVPEDFTIRGDNAAGASETWTITTGAVGGATTFNYNHKFIDCESSSTCAAPAAANTMDTTPEALASNVAKTDTEYFKLRLSTPTETGGDLSQHSTDVTVQASAF